MLPTVMDIEQKQEGRSRCFLCSMPIAAYVREVEEHVHLREIEEFESWDLGLV
jgi:hypothetical protein